MDQKQTAAMLRILGLAAVELANTLDGGVAPRKQVPAASASTPTVAAWEAKRVAFLQAFLDAGGELTTSQAAQAAKAAGVSNLRAIASRGYVERTGPRTTAITPLGRAWLKKRNIRAA